MKEIKSKLIVFSLVFALVLVVQIPNLLSQKAQKANKILVIPIKEEIAPAITRIVNKGIKNAKENKVDLIILDMNTYGGLLQDADSIRSIILESKTPIWVYINKNAASAGALISIACDKIYMQSGSNIGAATVVTESGEAAPDKYQSYMRGIMRATAEAKGFDSSKNAFVRNPLIAEAMVDQNIAVPGISDSGKVITLTVSEAIQYGFCDGQFDNLQTLIDAKCTGTKELIVQEASFVDQLIGWLLHPAVRGILIAGIVFGLYFEMQSPGLGFPSIAALGAAILYFAPAYLDGLAANWEIIVFIIGIILIVIELVAIPGFGIIGFGGIGLVLVSLVLSMIRNVNFDFTMNSSEKIFQSVAIVFLILVSFLIYILFFHKIIPHVNKQGIFSKVILSDTLSQSHITSIDSNLSTLIGTQAEVYQTCKPEGRIKIGNQIYNAKSLHGIKEKGQTVKIIELNNQCFVVV